MSSDSSKIMRGTMILTIGTLITKILGLIYIIPFYAIMGGEENLALYGYAYTPYVIMLSVAAAGVPGAVSKQVAKYNAMGAYQTSQKLYKSSLYVMFASGIVSFLVLFLLAPYIADLQMLASSGENHRWSNEDVTRIIRVVSFAVIVVPMMATWRGIFQGFESFGPTTMSAITEQIVRILFLLIGSFSVIYLFEGSVQTANEIAVFAAFISSIVALFTLFYYWKKRQPHIQKLIDEDNTNVDFSYKEMYLEIVKSGIPFIIVGISIPLIMFIDQLTHNNALALSNVPERLHDDWFGMLNITTHKLVMIPTSFAGAFAITILPFITKAFNKNDMSNVHSQIKMMVLMVIFFTLPAAVGMMILSTPIYTAFYEYNEMGSMILFFYAPVAILISLFTVTCSILQGIDKQNLTLYIVFTMLVIKAGLNIPLIMIFNTPGAIFSTMIALIVAVTLNILVIKKYGKFYVSALFKPIFEIIVYTLVMLFIVQLIFYAFMFNVDVENRMSSVFILIVTIPVGGIVYLLLTFKTGLADEILGERANSIRRKLKVL